MGWGGVGGSKGALMRERVGGWRANSQSPLHMTPWPICQGI